MLKSQPRIWITLLLGTALCLWGWNLFLFLTDDAFIAFRYIEQRQMGNGYVWNAAPFLPVEGYSCFGWIVLLDAVWSLTGIAPPDSANWLSLFCSLGTLGVTAHWGWSYLQERNSAEDMQSFFPWIVAGLVTNRLFLTWTSSGLETALFNLLLLGWIYGVFRLHQRVRKDLWWLTGLAAALALVRPDGYLFVLASSAILLGQVVRNHLSWKEVFGLGTPFVAVALHLMWRYSFYGEVLPNTYFAKVVGPMPDIGSAYLLSFVVEHGVWIWAIVVGLAAWKTAIWRRFGADWAMGMGVSTLLVHILYYAVVAGGDHFEYRILSHLAPLLALGGVWAVVSLSLTRTAALGTLFLVWIVSNCIPWIHFGVSQEHTEWTRSMPQYPIAQELPTVLQPLGERYDELQQWLFRHGVGMRHQHHKLFSEHQSRNLPSREVADSLVEGEKNALVVVTSAGIAGWRFRRAHAIDIFGLNDYVVARTPPKTAESARVVAHARQPPEGYVNAFRTNMIVTPSRISPFRKRRVPLEDAEIREIESRFRAALPEDRNTPMSER